MEEVAEEGAVDVVDVVDVAGFAAVGLVVVVAAAFGAVAYALCTVEEEKLRRGTIRYADGADLDDIDERREMPLHSMGLAAILEMQK